MRWYVARRVVWAAVFAVVVAGAMGLVSSSPASAAGSVGQATSPRVVAAPTDYCGTGDIDAPDQTFLFDFGSACQAHDICYGIGGSEGNRLACDQAFLTAMQASCVSKWPINGPWDVLNARSRKACENYARLYYFAVRVGGGSYFNYTPA